MYGTRDTPWYRGTRGIVWYTHPAPLVGRYEDVFADMYIVPIWTVDRTLCYEQYEQYNHVLGHVSNIFSHPSPPEQPRNKKQEQPTIFTQTFSKHIKRKDLYWFIFHPLMVIAYIIHNRSVGHNCWPLSYCSFGFLIIHMVALCPVSYTHLTLPTIYSV